MPEQTKTTPSHQSYAENREIFKAVRSTLQVSMIRANNELVERKEIYLTAVPESHKLNQEFEHIEFRIVESISECPTDKGGNQIVGGVNAYPEPVHVVLFVTPQILSLLSQRHISHPRADHTEFFITIYPATSMLKWNQEEAIPIYESVFLFQD